ncbi:MAG: PQQ-dependent sugar dehydrogenase [Patescibacteria group bacterium]
MEISLFFRHRWVRVVLVIFFLGATGFVMLLWWMFLASRTQPPLLAPTDEVQEEGKEGRAGSVDSADSVDLERPAISAIAQGLRIPWALDFLPDKRILFTERPGSVRLIDVRGKLVAEPALTLGDVAAVGEGGLLGIALHPRFSENNFVYLYYTARRGGAEIANRVVRYRLENSRLVAPSVILDDIPAAANHDGGRIAFGPDGMLYITTGDAGVQANAQNTGSLAGKILRLRDDGTVPDDNPFAGSPVWSYGHRNPQGLAWDGSGRLWATEHGPSAKDEINLIERGNNYGWPLGSGENVPAGTVAPIRQSGSATWAPSGAAIAGDTLYFVGLRGQELYALPLAEKDRGGELRSYFGKQFGRIRSVTVGPDGYFYLLTNNRDGRGIPQSEDDQIIRVHPRALEATQ